MTRQRPDDGRFDAPRTVSRRTALRTAGAAAVAAMTTFAGCSTDGAGSDSTPTDMETGDATGTNETSETDETDGSTETTEATQTEAADDEEWESWFEPTDNYDEFADHTGESEVTVMVGADGIEGPHAYEPPAIRVSPETTVVWEWTGAGGTHDVIDEDGGFESELVADEGHTFEQTFDEVGTTKYFCTPHKEMGMRGGIIVEE
ncbi:halocyanin domain-containing protein [Haloprofundus halobius]|uniref:halocyanin domain-containing protein n=1 Tax=Haloprofundus halobius TaxID=2876194 RepID=UPI001CCCA199|nr:halocyanin domain-containing protein [Haloprofundus halobius]